jgi:hypothetical protein
MKKIVLAAALFLTTQTCAQAAQTILFVGNSFTYAAHSAAMHYHPETVHDLNPPDARGETVGGVPALFKALTREAGLDYDVSLETVGGKGFDYHLAQKRALIDKPWDIVVGHGYSTLDAAHPGDPALLISTTRQMDEMLLAKNPQVKFYLLATWSRADMTYPDGAPWHGKPIQQMGKDVAAAYELAARGAPHIAGIVPMGLAWNNAIDTGIADDNPYDDAGASKMNLWAYDSYHASSYGYYLEALLDFGKVTNRDPQSLATIDHVAEDLGISPTQARALQKVAHDALAAQGSSFIAAK